MIAPLYSGAMEAASQAFRPKAVSRGSVWDGNAGLWYDKFCDRWQRDFDKLVEPEKAKDTAIPGGKQQWVDSVIFPRGGDGRPDTGKPAVKVGDPALLAEHAGRRERLAKARGGEVWEMTLTSRFATGLGRSHPIENGFAWHHALGVPFLAGSGVKGAVRAWIAMTASNEEAAAVFGPRPSQGEALTVGGIVVLDAVPVVPVQLAAEVTTPHTGKWNLASPDDPSSLEPPADWLSPTPIPFLVVEAGTVFQFVLLPRTPGTPIKEIKDRLVDALSWTGVGAKTATGFGRFASSGATPPKDPQFSFPADASSTGKGLVGRSTPSRRGTVDGEPVEILSRDGNKVTVRFIARGDIETVEEGEVE